MANIFDPEMQTLVNQYAAESFAEQRKRLRDARMRWIEENEAPKNYNITTRNPETGKEQSFSTPFQIGRLRYDQDDKGNPVEWSEAMKIPQTHDPAGAAALLDGIDAIIKEAEETDSAKQFTVLVSGNEQHGFITGGDADRSPHPPIEKGEDYAEYYARVSRAYERATGTGSGRPVANDDGLRESTGVDSPDIRRLDAPGASTGEYPGTALDCDADGLCSGDTGHGHAGDGGNTDTVSGASSGADNDRT